MVSALGHRSAGIPDVFLHPSAGGRLAACSGSHVWNAPPRRGFGGAESWVCIDEE